MEPPPSPGPPLFSAFFSWYNQPRSRMSHSRMGINTRPPPPGGFNFTYDPSLAPFAITPMEFLAAHPELSGIATGALVFAPGPGDNRLGDRLLLVQRAAHDSMPNCWEIPGGAVDDDDPSVLHGVARELWEESGLLVRHVVRQVGSGYGFFTRNNRKIFKLNFEVEVEVAGEAEAESKGEGEGEGDKPAPAEGQTQAETSTGTGTGTGAGAVRNLDPNSEGAVAGLVPTVTIDLNEHQRFLWVTAVNIREPKIIVDNELIEFNVTTPDQWRVLREGFRQRQGPGSTPFSAGVTFTPVGLW
jgi:8-oxo-dGTP pyrophosphatase MutT (NUDIX family)